MRLTFRTRNAIRSAVVNGVFGPKQEALQAEEAALAAEVYKVVVQPHARALRSLPAAWTRQARILHVNCKGERLGPLEMKKPQLLPLDGPLQLEPEWELTGRVRDLRKRQEAWKAERDRRHHELFRILEGFTTLKVLLEAWPELEEFLPLELVHAGKLPVPADIARMNEALGLGDA